MVIAPWLTPPNFLAASEAGARTGLSQQEMIRQSEEHAAELALRADELAAHSGQAAAALGQQQQQEQAGNDLKRLALSNDLILGQQHNQNEAAKVASDKPAMDARTELDLARANSLNQKGWMADENSRLRNLALQNLPDLLAAHPELTRADIHQSFPALLPSDLSSIPNKIAPTKTGTQSIIGHPNPAYAHGLNGGVDTNAPPFLYTTNTTMPLSLNLPATAPAAPDDAAASLPSPAQSGGIPIIGSQEEYDALPSGTKYYDSNGKVATKR